MLIVFCAFDPFPEGVVGSSEATPGNHLVVTCGPKWPPPRPCCTSVGFKSWMRRCHLLTSALIPHLGFSLSMLSHCRPSSWTFCFAAVSNCLTWRNTQRKLRRTLLVQLHAATPPCSTTAFLSASAPSCPSEEPPSEGYCQAWRFELCVDDGCCSQCHEEPPSSRDVPYWWVMFDMKIVALLSQHKLIVALQCPTQANVFYLVGFFFVTTILVYWHANNWLELLVLLYSEIKNYNTVIKLLNSIHHLCFHILLSSTG